MDLGLTNKIAIVTGGSRGIGASIVANLLEEGARVANIDKSAPDDEFLALSKERYFHLPTDLCDSDACGAAVSEIVGHFGRINVLVNNAGVNDAVNLAAGPAAFVDSLQRNLVHYYAMVHFARDELKKHSGAIVNIGSKVSLTGQGGTSAYAAAKGGINSLTREWAVALAPYSVRVNAVLPAETWTPMYADWIDSLENGAETKAAIESLIPLGRRFTTADELARTVVFLASDASSHTTGQILLVDGGYTHLDRKCTADGEGWGNV